MTRKSAATAPIVDAAVLSDTVELSDIDLSGLANTIGSSFYDGLVALVAGSKGSTVTAVENAVAGYLAALKDRQVLQDWETYLTERNSDKVTAELIETLSLPDATTAAHLLFVAWTERVHANLRSQVRYNVLASDHADKVYTEFVDRVGAAVSATNALGSKVRIRGKNGLNGATLATAPGSSVDGAGRGCGNGRADYGTYIAKQESIYRALSVNLFTDGAHGKVQVGDNLHTITLPIQKTGSGAANLAATLLDCIAWHNVILHWYAANRSDAITAAQYGASYPVVLDARKYYARFTNASILGKWSPAMTEQATIDLMSTSFCLKGMNQYVAVWDMGSYVPIQSKTHAA